MATDTAVLHGFPHRFVPAGAAQEGQTLLLLHGTGGDERDLLPLGRELAPQAALLSPRGQVSERGMPRFFRRFPDGRFDEDDLVRRAADLAGFVREAASTYRLDPARIYAAGYSNGANIAGAVLLLHQGILAGAVLIRPMLPLEPPRVPDLDGIPVLLLAGEADPYASRDSVERLAELLDAAGAAVDLRWAPAGHEVLPGEPIAAREWLGQVTAGH